MGGMRGPGNCQSVGEAGSKPTRRYWYRTHDRTVLGYDGLACNGLSQERNHVEKCRLAGGQWPRLRRGGPWPRLRR